jgi:hypothetical protein
MLFILIYWLLLLVIRLLLLHLINFDTSRSVVDVPNVYFVYFLYTNHIECVYNWTLKQKIQAKIIREKNQENRVLLLFLLLISVSMMSKTHKNALESEYRRTVNLRQQIWMYQSLLNAIEVILLPVKVINISIWITLQQNNKQKHKVLIKLFVRLIFPDNFCLDFLF